MVLIFEYVYILDSIQFYNLSHLNSFERTVENIRLAFSSISYCVILIKYSIHQKKIFKIINEIFSLERLLISFNREEYYKHRSLIYSVSVVYLSNIIIHIIVIATNEIQLYSKPYFILKYFPKLIDNHLIVQYTVVLKLLYSIFKNINNNFLHIFGKFKMNDEITFKNYFSRLHDLHFSLCKLSEDVSNFYSQPLFFCILYKFISFLLYSYYSSKPIVLGISTLPPILYIHCLFRVFHYFILFLFVTKSVTDVILEVSC